MAEIEQLRRARDLLIARRDEIEPQRREAQERERAALEESRAIGREYKDTVSAIAELERQIRDAENPTPEVRPGVDAIIQAVVAAAGAEANVPGTEV